MNRVYRLIWNADRGLFVVAHEGAKSKSKRSVKSAAVLLCAAFLFPSLCAQSLAPNALPSGGTVVSGQTTIATSGNQMNLHQASQKTILNWMSFDIGKDAAVNFYQPNAQAMALNRVTSGGASRIEGRLTANGQIFLINEAGVVFGGGAKVDVGAMTASALNISNEDFLAGNYHFSGKNNGQITNLGEIRAKEGGYIAFIAPSISNAGIISAKGGTALFAAGEKVRLNFENAKLTGMEVAAETLNTLIENKAAIYAEGGAILLTAAGMKAVTSAVIQNTGVLEASSLTEQGGRLFLSADTGIALGGELRADGKAQGGSIQIEAGKTLSLAGNISATSEQGQGGRIALSSGEKTLENTSSRINASGVSGGTILHLSDGWIFSSGTLLAKGLTNAGGKIDMTAQDVRLFSATLDASGATEGGLIRVGGAFQGGKNPDTTEVLKEGFVTRWGNLPTLARAQKVFISDGSNLSVSSDKGKAGTAVIWSDQQTTMLGSIAARGGTKDGFVEISSGQDLRQTNLLNLDLGKGFLLLDPKNIIIANTGTTTSAWTYDAILGKDFPGNLKSQDQFGSSVAFNKDGSLLAVGAQGDDGFGAQNAQSGAVYLFSFSGAHYAGAALEGIIGSGYTGGKNINLSVLDKQDALGTSLAFSADGTKLAAGAGGDDGFANQSSDTGAVYLFRFDADRFGLGSHMGTIGFGYTSRGDIHVQNLEKGDQFGGANSFWSGNSLSFSDSGKSFAVGVPLDDGFRNQLTDTGAVYLFQFTDEHLNGGSLQGIMGKGYRAGDTSAGGAGNNIDVANLGKEDWFGSGVAFAQDGRRLVVSAPNDDGYGDAVRDAGAAYLFSFEQDGYVGAALAGIIGSGYIGSLGGTQGKNVDASGFLEEGDNFGAGLAFTLDGTRLAVGTPSDDGYLNVLRESGAVHFISFRDGAFTDGRKVGTLGAGYIGAFSMDLSGRLEHNDRFGSSLALSQGAYGIQLAVGAPSDESTVNAGGKTGAVHLLSYTDPGISGSQSYLYTDNLGNQTVTLSNLGLSALLSRGTSVILQANNDITQMLGADIVGSGLTVGNLTLQAGRSIMLNANITTGGGNFTAIANDTAINGVVSGERDAGEAVLTMAQGTSINAGAGTVNLQIGTGFNDAAKGSGAMTLANITAGTIYGINSGGATSTNRSVAIQANSVLRASNAGNSLVLAGNQFINNAGANALQTPNGRFLVWSANPNHDNRGGLSYAFKQYNASFGATSVQTTTFGNGFLYSYAPTITPELIGTVTKTYDGTSTAPLTTANLQAKTPSGLDGLIDGDTAAFSLTSGSAFYSDPNASTANKLVKTGGIGLSGVRNGNAVVYGYTLTSSTAFGNIGQITPKTITATGITANNKVYDGTAIATTTGNMSFNGMISGDVLSYTGGTALFTTGKDVGNGKSVVFSGFSLSGASAGNYTLTSASITSFANITPKSVNLNATAQNKTYDGNRDASVTGSLNGLIAGEEGFVSYAGGTALFDTKHAGVGKTVTYSGFALNGAGAGNYVLSANTTNTTATITQKALTATINAQDKVYDKTSTATVAGSLTGVVSGDTVGYSGGQANFMDGANTTVNAGTWSVKATGFSLAGADAGNYTISNTEATNTATISPRTVSASFTADHKIYDGSTTATLSGIGFNGVLAGDALAASNTATFNTKDVGNNKTVSVVFVSDNGNYVISNATGFANIMPKALTLSIAAQNKVYDATTVAQLDTAQYAGLGYQLTGVVGSETVLYSGLLSFVDKNAAAGKTVSASNSVLTGADAKNYVLDTSSPITTTATISQRTLTGVAITAANRGYLSGDTSATITNTTYGNLVAGDLIATTWANANFASAEAGTHQVTAMTPTLNGTDAANYRLEANTTAYTTATILQSILSINWSASVLNKTYDGNTLATINENSYVLTGIQSGDIGKVLPFGAYANFNDKNVGTGKSVVIQGLSLTGASAGNYILQNTSYSTTANITAKVLDVGNITAADKTYNGNTSTTGSYAVNGLIAGDAVALNSGTFAFNDKNAGVGKTVTLNGYGITGADAGNYSLSTTTPLTTTASIYQASLTASIAVKNKEYDSRTTAQFDTAQHAGLGYKLEGLIAGDSVLYTGGTLSFSDKNAGAGKTVTASGFGLTGAESANYVLNNPVTTTIADITKKAIYLSITANDKIYDGTNLATLKAGSLDGLITGDRVGYIGGTLTFDSKDVARSGQSILSKTVTAKDFTLVGNDVGNYNFFTDAAKTQVLHTATGITTLATITPKAISASITANDKTYDGTRDAMLIGALNGLITNDTVSLAGLSGANAFADKNAGAGKLVTASGLSLSGGDSGNYTLTNTSATTTADIARKTITAQITAQNKVYDGTTNASLTSSAFGVGDVVSGDFLTLSTGSLFFNSKDVATASQVTASDLALSGRDAANYQLSSATAVDAAARITPKELTVSFTADNKTYDGGTTATIQNNGIGLGGLVGNETLITSGGTATFADKNAGNNILVTLTGITLSNGNGGLASNYILSPQAATDVADIAKKQLTASVGAIEKTYDGTRLITLHPSDFILSGKLGSDAVSIAGSQAGFVDKNVGTNKGVVISGITLNGADRDNYEVGGQIITAGTITPKTITAQVSAHDKVYDGTDSTQFTVENIHSLIAPNDDVHITGTASFSDKNAGQNKDLFLAGFHLTGQDAANYVLNNSAQHSTASIQKASLVISADNQIRYEFMPNPTLTAKYQGFVAGESLSDFSGGVLLATSARRASHFGRYTIFATGDLASDNYEVSYQNGALMVLPGFDAGGIAAAYSAPMVFDAHALETAALISAQKTSPPVSGISGVFSRVRLETHKNAFFGEEE